MKTALSLGKGGAEVGDALNAALPALGGEAIELSREAAGERDNLVSEAHGKAGARACFSHEVALSLVPLLQQCLKPLAGARIPG